MIKDSLASEIKQRDELVALFFVVFDAGQNYQSPSGIVDTEVKNFSSWIIINVDGSLPCATKQRLELKDSRVLDPSWLFISKSDHLFNRFHVEYFIVTLVVEVLSMVVYLIQTCSLVANLTPESSSMHHVEYQTLIQVDFLLDARAPCMESYDLLVVNLAKGVFDQRTY